MIRAGVVPRGGLAPRGRDLFPCPRGGGNGRQAGSQVGPVNPGQDLLEPLGVDLPPHGRDGTGTGHVPDAGPRLRGVVGHHVPGVVVDSQEVHGLGDQLQISRFHRRLDLPRLVPGEGRVGVAAPEEGIEKPPALEGQGPLGRLLILRSRGGGDVGVEIQADAHPARQVELAEGLQGEPVGEEQVVAHPDRGGQVPQARRVLAVQVPQEGDHPWLVDGQPELHPVAQPFHDGDGQVPETGGGLPAGPAPLGLQSLGQVPVVEGDQRLDLCVQKAIHQPVIEVQAGGVGRAPPRWGRSGAS